MLVSVTDILNVLKQVPEWIGLKEMLTRMKALEARVAALEATLAKPAAPPCPLCGKPMKTTAVAPHPQFGRHGWQDHTLACTDCPHTETRTLNPTKP